MLICLDHVSVGKYLLTHTQAELWRLFGTDCKCIAVSDSRLNTPILEY